MSSYGDDLFAKDIVASNDVKCTKVEATTEVKAATVEATDNVKIKLETTHPVSTDTTATPPVTGTPGETGQLWFRVPSVANANEGLYVCLQGGTGGAASPIVWRRVRAEDPGAA